MTGILKDKKIIVCITSSIACIELPKLIRELRRQGAIVHCFMSRAAQNILHENAIEWASKNKVITQLTGKCEHIYYSQDHKADLILVAPATANIIAKTAYGISDSAISSMITAGLGANIPIMMIPCMHLNLMNKLTKYNLSRLKILGIDIISPKIEENKAKFPEIQKIADIIKLKFTSKDLKNRKIIVTAGATREDIDPIRFITNKSTGKMGISIADQAFMRGAIVTLIRANTSVEPKFKYRDIKVNSANEMYSSIKDNINIDEHIDNSDGKNDKIIDEKGQIIIHCAAVSDFRVETQVEKLKSENLQTLELHPNPKIIDQIKKLNSKIFLIGFKAESNLSDQELAKKGYEKLNQSNADIIVANDISRKGVGFGYDTTECLIIQKNARTSKLPFGPKTEIANQILNFIR